MPIVNVRELSRGTGKVIGAVVRTGRPAVVTKGGRPVALVSALDPDDLEDWFLSNAPEFVRGMRSADADLTAGRTISLDDYLARTRPPRGARARAGRTRRGTRGA
ncbi:MAG: type II toxin-antitoxin system Phd/YefM family antitoxin [Candidatus Limnocylindria bacterium]